MMAERFQFVVASHNLGLSIRNANFWKRKHQKKWVFDYTWQRPLSIEPVDEECICRGGVVRRIFQLVHSQSRGSPR